MVKCLFKNFRYIFKNHMRKNSTLKISILLNNFYCRIFNKDNML